MHVLITGGAGFIGSHLAAWHINMNDEVIVLDDLSSGKITNLQTLLQHPRFKFIQENILNCTELANYVCWADRIYHLAAIVGVFKVIADPINVLSTNILSCEYLLKTVVSSHAKPTIIIASSSSVYGKSKKQLFSEKNDLIVKNIQQPISIYSVSKMVCEEFAFSYFKQYKLPTIVVRLFNIIGPNQTAHYGNVVPRFIQQAVEEKPITVFGDGEQKRSFCDIRDAICALSLLAANTNAIGKTINIGNDYEISINALAKLICNRASSQSPIIHIPYAQAYHKDFIDITHRRPNIKNLYKLTQFKPKWKLEQTLDQLLEFEREKIKVHLD